MRFLKLTNAKNPDDYILLNGGYFDKEGNKIDTFSEFNGFLCTSFQTIGISRKLEFLAIKNRQFVVDNKTNFKKYSLTIEILSKFSEYERKHRELISFLDKNKKDGFRLYYRPYDNEETRYCLCDIESSVRTEKLQPVVLTLTQDSLWLGVQKNEKTAQVSTEKENAFEFKKNENITVVVNGQTQPYYSTGFLFDNDTGIYCIEFFDRAFTQTTITNDSYNEVPLNVRIYGRCVNPTFSLYDSTGNKLLKQFRIVANIESGDYIEINSNILENGIWYMNSRLNTKSDYTKYIDNSKGSPYFYIGHGDYVIKVEDEGSNVCLAEVFFQEEYSE